jgi:hypothetical protein
MGALALPLGPLGPFSSSLRFILDTFNFLIPLSVWTHPFALFYSLSDTLQLLLILLCDRIFLFSLYLGFAGYICSDFAYIQIFRFARC